MEEFGALGHARCRRGVSTWSGGHQAGRWARGAAGTGCDGAGGGANTIDGTTSGWIGLEPQADGLLFELDVETAVDFALDGVAQGCDVGGGRVAAVDEG